MNWRAIMEHLARTNPRLVLKLIELERQGRGARDQGRAGRAAA